MRFDGVLNVIDAKGIFNLWFRFCAHGCILFLVLHAAKTFLICGFSLDDGNVFFYDQLR